MDVGKRTLHGSLHQEHRAHNVKRGFRRGLQKCNINGKALGHIYVRKGQKVARRFGLCDGLERLDPIALVGLGWPFASIKDIPAARLENQ